MIKAEDFTCSFCKGVKAEMFITAGAWPNRLQIPVCLDCAMGKKKVSPKKERIDG